MSRTGPHGSCLNKCSSLHLSWESLLPSALSAPLTPPTHPPCTAASQSSSEQRGPAACGPVCGCLPQHTGCGLWQLVDHYSASTEPVLCAGHQAWLWGGTVRGSTVPAFIQLSEVAPDGLTAVGSVSECVASAAPSGRGKEHWE